MAANDEPCCNAMFWIYLLICVALVSLAGLMSGLTLGLMSLSLVDLEVLAKAGRAEDRRNAAKILPVVKKQHLLLCTLLIGNSLAMEALPIFLDALLPAWGAILISVTLILAFGEIIPQAVCSRYGLKVGAKLVVFVRFILVVFFPIAYPISKLLDWLLGKGHFALLRRAELKTLVDMHGNEAGKGGELTHDETTIISGALDLTQKTVRDAMTPISETFALDINSKLNWKTMELMMTKGHSRVPVYSENPKNIVGLILVKNLITSRPEDETPIRNLTLRKIPRVPESKPLYDMLNEFQMGLSHMAVVVKSTGEAAGAATENGKGKTVVLEKRRVLKRARTQPELNGIFDGRLCMEERLKLGRVPSPMNLLFTDNQSPRLRSTENRGTPSRTRKWDRGSYDNIIDFNLTPLPSYPPDEEVLGIITMEDVMEELLQKNSSPRSPGISYLQKRTPLPSPLASYHHSPILRSPASPVALGPLPAPTLSVSPGKSPTSSPAKAQHHPGRSSPASHRVRTWNT
ncbi:hypothetical protein H6P81_008217 [Aristolochia fimbriata]|uniref:CNNM transmembrane domain-containing protein n=1 Tax=Aristolochia fimbriata TaxID=158543 RepID=A0AAV7F6X7_ARIFI|nr:hypothetical protein H6P81_008217 [Aristolochia fimbriata]